MVDTNHLFEDCGICDTVRMVPGSKCRLAAATDLVLFGLLSLVAHLWIG